MAPEPCSAAILVVNAPGVDQAFALDENWDHVRGRHTDLGQALHDAKYEGGPGSQRALREACDCTAHWTQWLWSNRAGLPTPDAIVPVPAHGGRTYAPITGALARAAKTGIARTGIDAPVDEDLLCTTRRVAPMKHVPRHLRAELLQGSMRVRRVIAGATIVVVDDLFESGSTMAACAAALRDAGAATIIGVAVARVRRGLQRR